MTRNDDRERLQAIEQGERWLAGFSTQSPSAEQFALMKTAARSELSRRASTLSHGRWSRGTGALAAAATIVLAVTIGWYSMSPPSIPTTRLTQGTTETSETESVVVVNRVEDDLSSLESWSKELPWDLTGATMSQALDELYNESAENGAVRRNNS